MIPASVRLPNLPRLLAVALALTAGGTGSLPAQLISPKTVPVHQGEQFGIFPAQWPGMGGVSIALPDTLGDLWSNPAKATRLQVGSVQVMPFTHSATSGGGRSLPVSLLQTSGSFAGGVLYSAQELERTDSWWNQTISDRRASNTYYAAVLARRFGGGLAVGAGVSYADLGGVDGVGALYSSSDRVRQSGTQLDARLGLTRDFEGGGTLELVAVSYRYRMSHEVHYPQTWRWLAPCDCPLAGDCSCDPPFAEPERTELNLDRTNNAGLQTVYLSPKTESGWRMGYLFTANRLSHPKIPNYQIQNIPRDPGNTDAFNVGFGLARNLGHSTFGVDVIMEPMWSHTWADAAGDTMNVNGDVLRQGAHTVDNHFRFSNSRVAVGFGHDFPGSNDSAMTLGIQAGVAMRTIRYTLDQSNHVSLESRTQNEAWTEWTPTFAIRMRGRDLEVSYALSYTCGPTCFSLGDRLFVVADAAPAAPGVIAAPSAPLTFDGGSAGQHRIMVSIRLR